MCRHAGSLEPGTWPEKWLHSRLCLQKEGNNGVNWVKEIQNLYGERNVWKKFLSGLCQCEQEFRVLNVLTDGIISEVRGAEPVAASYDEEVADEAPVQPLLVNSDWIECRQSEYMKRMPSVKFAQAKSAGFRLQV